MANNDERPFRLRPRRSRGNPNDDPRKYGGALGSLLRSVQMANRRRATAGKRSQAQARSPWDSRTPRTYSQRVSVRVDNAKNKNPGQWKAHGTYIARDSATKEALRRGPGLTRLEQTSILRRSWTLGRRLATSAFSKSLCHQSLANG